MKLLVEIDDFVEAARSMRHEVAENVELCLAGVTRRLASELVGVDPAGAAWAADYDAAARSVLAASALIANGAYRTSQLFAASGHNYAAAESASTTGGGDAVDDWSDLLASTPAVEAPAVPSAGGAGSDTPADWWLVEHTVGYVWPGGHQDKLRATAEAWRSSANGIELGGGVPLGITGRFIADGLPEADDMQRVCSGLHDRLTTLVAGYRSLADACDEYATHLDVCHTQIRDELTDLVVESAALQAGGALLSVFTAGLAELPTQAAQIARAAATAARIGRLIEKLIEAAKLVGAGVARVGRIADEIRTSAECLAATRLVYAGVTDVPRLRRAERMAADGRQGARGVRPRDSVAPASSAGDVGRSSLWTSWAEYPKHERDGVTYAIVGDRLYAKHAVDRLQPRALGSPPGAVGAGRSISPNFVEDVLRSDRGVATVGPRGESRLLHESGDVRVITEQDVVVTVMRVR